ncbi:MAG: sigma-E processing peptidase SpoIIGA [Firmicutes bacterium]|nr:sigma-E processing peptidase SpoIIGA [Bacillota bacterium]
MTFRINLYAYSYLFTLLTVQGYVLLWATKMITGYKVKSSRLLAGALLFAAYDILVDLATYGLFPSLRLLVNPAVVIGFSLVLLVVLFKPNSLKNGLKLAGYFYGLAFFSAGCGLAVQSLTGLDWSGPVVSILTVLLTGEIGWNIVQNWLWEKTLRVPLEIRLGPERFQTTALLDTGNSLRDPLSGVPVVIVESALFAEATDPNLQALVAAASSGELTRVSELVYDSPWSTRVRLIPYTTLGQNNGLLVGIKPDFLQVHYGGETLGVANAVIGIHDRPLSDDGTYKALLHPELLQRIAVHKPDNSKVKEIVG